MGVRICDACNQAFKWTPADEAAWIALGDEAEEYIALCDECLDEWTPWLQMADVLKRDPAVGGMFEDMRTHAGGGS